jgi:hypothetical protein
LAAIARASPSVLALKLTVKVERYSTSVLLER